MHKKTDALLVWGFTAVLALFCVFLVWFVPTRAGLDFQLADIDKSLETSYGRERKQQYEDFVEALFVLKLAEHYDCKITYQEGKPNYLFLETTAGSRRTFADSIGLGF